MNQKRRLLLILFLSLILLGLGLLFAFLVTKGFKIYCPIYKFTGLSCPGCGNTRATFALLRFDFKAMLRFNLLYPVEMLYLARVYLSCSKNFIKSGQFRYHSRPDALDVACLASLLIWTVIRNFLAL